MKTFNEFGIKPEVKTLEGDKIKIERIFNREIIVEDYQIKDSKYEEGTGKCLHMQIKIGENKHVVFTGSSVLMDMIQRVNKNDFPFKTTIQKSNDHYQFT